MRPTPPSRRSRWSPDSCGALPRSVRAGGQHDELLSGARHRDVAVDRALDASKLALDRYDALGGVEEDEADIFTVRADALRANADLVQLQAVEKWDGKLPTTMVPSSALPFINVQPTARN